MLSPLLECKPLLPDALWRKLAESFSALEADARLRPYLENLLAEEKAAHEQTRREAAAREDFYKGAMLEKLAEILDRQKGAENSRTREADKLAAILRYDRERGAGDDAQTARDTLADLREGGKRLPIQPKTLQNLHAEWVRMGRPGTLAEYQQGKAEQAAKRNKARKAKKAGRK